MIQIIFTCKDNYEQRTGTDVVGVRSGGTVENKKLNADGDPAEIGTMLL
jgi:hypothetical protein